MNNDNPMLMKVEKVQMCQRSPHVDTAPEDRQNWNQEVLS